MSLPQNEQQYYYLAEELERKSALLLTLKAQLLANHDEARDFERRHQQQRRQNAPTRHAHKQTLLPDSDISFDVAVARRSETAQDCARVSEALWAYVAAAEVEPMLYPPDEEEVSPKMKKSHSATDDASAPEGTTCNIGQLRVGHGPQQQQQQQHTMSRIPSVQVRAGRALCTFALPLGHTFRDLLSDVRMYWEVPVEIMDAKTLILCDSRGAVFHNSQMVEPMLAMCAPPRRVLQLHVREQPRELDMRRHSNARGVPFREHHLPDVVHLSLSQVGRNDHSKMDNTTLDASGANSTGILSQSTGILHANATVVQDAQKPTLFAGIVVATAGDNTNQAKASKQTQRESISEAVHMKQWKRKYRKLDLILADHDMDTASKVLTTTASPGNTSTKADPTRKAKQASLMIELVAWVPFLILFALAVMPRFGADHGVAQSMVLKQRLIGRQSTWRQDVEARFYDIASVADFWQWAQGPLTTTFAANQSACRYYNASDTTTESSAAAASEDYSCVAQSNVVVGAIRFRQQRTRRQECALEFDVATSWCHRAYHRASRDESDLPHCTDSAVEEDYCTFADSSSSSSSSSSPLRMNDDGDDDESDGDDGVPEWKEAAELTWYDHGALVSTYDASGYFAQARPSPGGGGADHLAAMVTELFNASWIDESTRVVMIEFNTVNPQTRRVGIVKMVFQFITTGDVRPSLLVLVTEPLPSAVDSWATTYETTLALLIAVAYLLGMLLAPAAARIVTKWCRSDDTHSRNLRYSTAREEDCGVEAEGLGGFHSTSSEPSTRPGDSGSPACSRRARSTRSSGGAIHRNSSRKSFRADGGRRQWLREMRVGAGTAMLKRAVVEGVSDDLWRLMDVSIAVVGLIVCALQLHLAALSKTIQLDNNEYRELYTMIGLIDWYARSLLAALCGVVALRALKYFKLLRQGQHLLSAAQYSTQPLVVLSVLIAFPILLGLALFTWLVFGPVYPDFASFGNALVSIEQLARGANQVGDQLPVLHFPLSSTFVLVSTLVAWVLFARSLFVVVMVESFEAVAGKGRLLE